MVASRDVEGKILLDIPLSSAQNTGKKVCQCRVGVTNIGHYLRVILRRKLEHYTYGEDRDFSAKHKNGAAHYSC